jgi:hypothetical protein
VPAVKLTIVEVVLNVDEHASMFTLGVAEQSLTSVTPSALSKSSKNLWGAPSALDSIMVTVSPCVTVIVGFVLFQ